MTQLLEISLQLLLQLLEAHSALTVITNNLYVAKKQYYKYKKTTISED